MQNNQLYYRQHVWNDAPLFHLPWWLDAVCGDNWKAVVLKNGDQMRAYYLFAMKKDALGLHIVMPPLTQFLGPNYTLSSAGIRQRNNEEIEVLEQLLDQLPKCSSFESRWHFRFQNWLPFYWKGFKQTTRYTYLLEDISDPDMLRENFSEKIRREINKAEKQFSVEWANDVTEFYRLLTKNFLNKKMQMPFRKSLLDKIFTASQSNHAGKVFLAKDDAGKIAAAIFIIWDATTAYYLIGGKDDDFGNSGAMSLLFWAAFNDLKGRVKTFDFEGSMIKGVENYFRSFGAIQKGYFEITKISSQLLKAKSAVKSLLHRR